MYNYINTTWVANLVVHETEVINTTIFNKNKSTIFKAFTIDIEKIWFDMKMFRKIWMI